MIFATASLARRIERAETTLITDTAEGAAERVDAGAVFTSRLNGGAAVFIEPDCPCNKVVGLGFEGEPDARVLQDIEQEYARRGAPVRVEISTLADPAVAAMFTRRGYALTGFENVLGLPLDSAILDRLRSLPAPAGVGAAQTAPEGAAAWADAVITGFLTPDRFDGPDNHEAFPRQVLERAYDFMGAGGRFVRYDGRLDGALAGGGALRIFDGVAQLCGAATLPQFRRRGVQSTLLRQRLLDAAALGCDVAVVTTSPGSKSQENVQRAGFELLYARAILERGTGPIQT
jgi:ribosomal protein S18 acetylase RimI-like enzyme